MIWVKQEQAIIWQQLELMEAGKIRTGTVKSRKQAIAIGLSEARKKGKKVLKKKAS